MDKKKAQAIVEAIDGWKTIIGAVGTPIASLIVATTPPKTVANQAALYFSILFGATGVIGVLDKYRKGELPSQISVQAQKVPNSDNLPEGLRHGN